MQTIMIRVWYRGSTKRRTSCLNAAEINNLRLMGKVAINLKPFQQQGFRL